MTYDIALATDSHGHEDDLQYAWVYLIRQGREKCMRFNNSFYTHRFERKKRNLRNANMNLPAMIRSYNLTVWVTDTNI